MAVTLHTHRLNSQDGELEVASTHATDKRKIQHITWKKPEVTLSFQIDKVWINQQPAKLIKGVADQLSQSKALFCAQEREGKLYLTCDELSTMKVHVREENRYLTLNLSPQLKIKGLHQCIAQEIGRSNFEIRDQKGGAQFAQSDTLLDCGITSNSALTLINQTNSSTSIDANNSGKASLEDGMGLSTLPFVNFRDGQILMFDTKAPVWRTVEKGLNLEGKCLNSACKAYNQFVCAPQGINVFYMHETCAKAICPSCTQKLDRVSTNNCIFWDCLYTIEGQEEKSDAVFKVEAQQAPYDSALSFARISADHKSNIVNWRYLKITTTSTSSSCTLL